MTVPAFDPRQGGVKVVFDVPEDAVDDAVREMTAAGFGVGRYYSDEAEHRVGGSAPGWIRLGAERPMREFTTEEQDRIVAAFDAVVQESTVTCLRMGTDAWTAGGDDGSAGDREPRRPAPLTDSHNART